METIINSIKELMEVTPPAFVGVVALLVVFWFAFKFMLKLLEQNDKQQKIVSENTAVIGEHTSLLKTVIQSWIQRGL